MTTYLHNYLFAKCNSLNENEQTFHFMYFFQEVYSLQISTDMVNSLNDSINNIHMTYLSKQCNEEVRTCLAWIAHK
jgi:hypothetical protein